MSKILNSSMVERSLKTYPRARQDDKFLLLAVWEQCGLILTEDQMRLFLSDRIPSSESIRRTRQKFHEAGKYLPPKAVQEARKEMAEDFRKEVVQTRLI